MSEEWYAHVQKLRDKMERCSYASRYKGAREPNCNKGNPCNTCRRVWSRAEAFRREQKAIPGAKFISLPEWSARQDARIRQEALVLAKELKKGNVAMKKVAYNKADKFGRSSDEKLNQRKRIVAIYERAMAAKGEGRAADFQNIYIEFVSECAQMRKPFLTAKKRTDMLLLASIGVSSEAGEQLDIIKKVFFHDRTGHAPMRKDRREKLILELGDVLWYYVLLLKMLGLTLEDVIAANMQKLVGRDY